MIQQIPGPVSILQDLILKEFVEKKRDKQGREKDSLESYSLEILKEAENMNICFNRLYPAVQFGQEHQTILKQIKDFKKKAFLDAIVKRFSLDKGSFESALFYETKRLEMLVESLRSQGYHANLVQVKTVSRIIVGLGEQTPFETGIKLHHIYGYPIIPSTALKGVTRAWLEQAESFDESEGIELSAKIYNEAHRVFGSASKDEKWKKNFDIMASGLKHVADSKLGDVMFFDAFPASAPKLEVEIMNPHYSDYYSKPDEFPPGDWYSPKPIFFLVVASGTQFTTALASRSKQSFQKAKEWLHNGLSEMGIGSKTSSGYGYFEHPDEAKRLEELEMAKVEERLAKEEAERPDWAKELERQAESEQEVNTIESGSDDQQKILDLLDQDPTQFVNKAYEIWQSLNDDMIKIKMAKAFFEKQSNYMKKKIKQEKKYAITLQNWSEKT